MPFGLANARRHFSKSNVWYLKRPSGKNMPCVYGWCYYFFKHNWTTLYWKLRRFLGRAGYYRKFFRYYAKMVQPFKKYLGRKNGKVP